MRNYCLPSRKPIHSESNKKKIPKRNKHKEMFENIVHCTNSMMSYTILTFDSLDNKSRFFVVHGNALFLLSMKTEVTATSYKD